MQSNKELLHAIWVIRNWSNNRGNMQSDRDVLSKIAEYSKEVFEKHRNNTKEQKAITCDYRTIVLTTIHLREIL